MTDEGHSRSEDTFAGLDNLGKPGKQVESSGSVKKITTRADHRELDINSGTRVYVGKKITGSFEVNQNTGRLKDTTLGGISIDTNITDQTGCGQDQESGKLSQTTIEMELQHSSAGNKKASLSSIIEDGETFLQIDASARSLKGRKEPSAKNISVDISSDQFFNAPLPSGSEPEQLGSGVISGLLGVGGMSKVYRVWNEKLEIDRAVKLLLPSNQQDNWKRFQTEAKISAKLHHSNIVEIHAVGEWHGLPFIEMEFIDGEALNVLISRFKALPSSVCLAIAVQVARALAYAHQKEILINGRLYHGLIHRDLKPSNIMVGMGGVVKLMDFGVARPVETGLHTVNTEAIVGTMQYFSPEQIHGYPIDQLSDIYSFGVVLYEMICGVNPFPQNKMVQLIHAKTRNSFARLESYHRRLDPRLSSVAQVCLRTEKSTRFSSSAQLRDYLEEYHRMYSSETPEDVIQAFFIEPERVYREDEQRFSSIIAVGNQGGEQKPEDETEQTAALETQPEPDTVTQGIMLKVNRYHVGIGIALLISAMIIIGVVMIFSRNAQAQGFEPIHTFGYIDAHLLEMRESTR